MRASPAPAATPSPPLQTQGIGVSRQPRGTFGAPEPVQGSRGVP